MLWCLGWHHNERRDDIHMEEVRYGIVGVGNEGSYYLWLYNDKQIKNCKITAICDINPLKIENAKKIMDGQDVKYFTDYREMVDSGLVDAVMVVTPHYSHAEISEYCLEKGIHALCDKPAGVYTKQVREMNECSSKSNAIFGMMFNQRTNCVFRKMHELIANGEIGELQRVTWLITDWFRTQSYYDSGSWRATWQGEGGGVLINQCPHQLDLLQWVIGKTPVSVNGFCEYGKWHDIEVEDEVTAYLKFDNGATGVFITTTGETPGTNRFEVCGTKGKITCENNTELYLYKNEAETMEHIKTAKDGFQKPKCEKILLETDGENRQHAGIIDNFTNPILGTEKLYVPGTEGIKGVELMNAIELSGWRGGETVTIPVNEEEYLEVLNAKRATSRFKEAKDVIMDTSSSFGAGNTKK